MKRTGPPRPYLNKLTCLLLEAPQWKGDAEAAALDGLCQLIGAIQYFVVVAPTFSGIYGDVAFRKVNSIFSAHIHAAAVVLIQDSDQFCKASRSFVREAW